MYIKLSIICMFFPSIIIDARDVREKPVVESVTRGGKFFGLFPVRPYKVFVNKNKHWKGQFVLAFGRHPLIATAVEFNHGIIRDPLCFFCLQYPQQFNTLVNQHAQQHHQNNQNHVDSFHPLDSTIQYDPLDNTIELPLNTKPSTILASATAQLSTATEAITTSTMTKSSSQDASRILKLEDYDVSTFDPSMKDDDENALNRVRRESEDLVERMESTTIESSTMSEQTIMPEEVKEDSSNNHVVTISPMLELPQNPPQDFSSTTPHVYDVNNKYPPSRYPSAQYISIAHKPFESYMQPQPIKNYYDFNPSQPDLFYHNYHNYMPLCLSNYFRNKFAPIIYDNSNWPQNSANQNYYQWK